MNLLSLQKQLLKDFKNAYPEKFSHSVTLEIEIGNRGFSIKVFAWSLNTIEISSANSFLFSIGKQSSIKSLVAKFNEKLKGIDNKPELEDLQ